LKLIYVTLKPIFLILDIFGLLNRKINLKKKIFVVSFVMSNSTAIFVFNGNTINFLDGGFVFTQQLTCPALLLFHQVQGIYGSTEFGRPFFAPFLPLLAVTATTKRVKDIT
jgi:hypothetical protein